MGKKDKKPKMPKRIYVGLRQEAGSGEVYLNATEQIADKDGDTNFNDNERVGVYELVEVKKLKKQIVLE